MLLSALTSLLALVALGAAQDTSLGEVEQAFSAFNVTNALDVTFTPTLLLEVAFPQSSGPEVLVNAGVQLPRNDTAIPPLFSISSSGSNTDPSGTFVIAMVDLDAPTPQMPNESQIRHFLGGNFQLLDFNAQGDALLSNSTPALSEFLQPTPPAGSDPHRYIFLLFQQPDDFNGVAPQFVNATTPVENFSIAQFADETGLGSPLGGSFMRVGPDPST